MFREKLKKNSDEPGYLYIRETVYKRDRRTLKRIPKKLGNGDATKTRGKHSKKVDIYCGRIIPCEMKYFINFEDYLKEKNIDIQIFKLKSNFNEILNEFVNYLIFIYDIDYIEFYDENQKKCYKIGNGYISPIILSWFKRFNLNGNPNNLSELKRFAYRCQDIGIFDDEITHKLYLKLIPEEFLGDIDKEIKEMEFVHKSSEKMKFDGLKGFLKENN